MLIPVLLILVFLALAIALIPKLQIDNSLKRWVASDTKEIIEYQRFLENFGGDAFVIAVIEIPKDLSDAKIDSRIADFREEISSISSVTFFSRMPVNYFATKKIIARNLQCYAISFSPPSHLNPNRPELLKKIKNLLNKTSFKWHLAGTGVIYDAINQQTKYSIRIFLTIGILLLLIVLLLILKRLSALLLSFGVSFFGVHSLLISAVIFDIPLNMANIILPVLVLFYGTSSSLHILSHGGDFKKVVTPCIIATMTTTAGFLVFLSDPIPLLHDFAILAISGIVGGLVWAYILFHLGDYSFPAQNVGTVFDLVPVKWPFALFWVFLLILIISIPGIGKLNSDIYSLSILPKDNKAVKDHIFIEKNIGNYFPLEYMVNPDSVDPVDVYDWISSVYELDEIEGEISYLSFLPFGDAKKNGYLSEDEKLARVTFLAPLLPTSKGLALVHKIDALGTEYFSANIPKVTGFVTIYGALASRLGTSFINSLMLAFLAVFLILLIYLRNIKLFIASILPNIFPILIILGLMGWLNIPLDMVTVPIGCLLLSIIVDDTIHFLYWFKKTLNINDAYKKAGPGILYTTLVLVCGFSVFLISSSPPIRNFGILSVTALLSALIADLILLPMILKVIYRKELKTFA